MSISTDTQLGGYPEHSPSSAGVNSSIVLTIIFGITATMMAAVHLWQNHRHSHRFRSIFNGEGEIPMFDLNYFGQF
jgi:hypothetical protein